MKVGITYENNIVQSFVALGFPLSEKALNTSSKYLDELFPPVNSQYCGFSDIGDLLEKILSEIIEEERPEKLLIPLSSGLDSRAILGAALNIFPKSKISCVTVGAVANSEVIGAQTVCAKFGIPHHRIDPNTFNWSSDLCVARALSGFDDCGTYASYELCLFDEMARFAKPKMLVLSGFLGDVGSGAHLVEGHYNDSQQAIEQFFKHNSVVDRQECQQFESILERFIDEHLNEIQERGYDTLTRFDLLDVAMRQGLRIRGVANIENAPVRQPFAHPHWNHFWFNQTPCSRVGQVAYKAGLKSRYPEVFCLPFDKVDKVPPQKSPPLSLGRRAIRKANRIVRRIMKRNQKGLVHTDQTERGDLRRNESKVQLMNDLTSSFLERKIPVGLDVRSVLDAFDRCADTRLINKVNRIATVECHLQAGTLYDDPPTMLKCINEKTSKAKFL